MTASAVDITLEMFDDPAFTVEIQMQVKLICNGLWKTLQN